MGNALDFSRVYLLLEIANRCVSFPHLSNIRKVVDEELKALDLSLAPVKETTEWPTTSSETTDATPTSLKNRAQAKVDASTPQT